MADVLLNRPRSIALAGEIADRFYARLRHAREEGRPVAWISHYATIPILVAMDIAYFFGDPFAATCAARHVEDKPQRWAEDAGMLSEVCSYSRTTLGNMYWPKDQKVGEDPCYDIPDPDFLINHDPGCHMLVWEYMAAQKHTQKPLFYIRSPFIWEWTREREEEVIQDQVRQYQELIIFLEDMTHRRFDWERLRQAVAKLRAAVEYRVEAMNTAAAAVPAPFSFYDWAAALGAITYAAGTDPAIECMRAMRDEAAERVARNEGVVPNEKVRLFWEGHSAWPHLRFYSETLASNDAVMVGGKYTHIGFYHIPEALDPADPLRGLAVNSLLVLAYDLEWYADRLTDICRKWKIDALVGHFSHTCRIMCGSHFELADIISRRLGIPTIFVESDVADPKFMSPENTALRLQALTETIKVRKGYK